MIAKEFGYFTYEEYLDYCETTPVKMEYFDGEIVLMAPVKPMHNKVQNNIFKQIDRILEDCGKCDVYTSDVSVRFKNEEVDREFLPDIFVACDDKFEKSRCVGSPRRVVEVMSQSTKAREKGSKKDTFEAFGVKEYWLVDIDRKSIKVFNDNINGEYTSIKTYFEEDIISYLNEEIKVSDCFKVKLNIQ